MIADFRFRFTTPLLVGLLLIGGFHAGNDANAQELDSAQIRAEAEGLMREAEEERQAGNHDAAKETEAEAKELLLLADRLEERHRLKGRNWWPFSDRAKGEEQPVFEPEARRDEMLRRAGRERKEVEERHRHGPSNGGKELGRDSEQRLNEVRRWAEERQAVHGAGPVTREGEERQRRLSHLLRAIEDLSAAGFHETADRLRQQARRWKADLHAFGEPAQEAMPSGETTEGSEAELRRQVTELQEEVAVLRRQLAEEIKRNRRHSRP